jgi:HrpA-like RNA helicase
MRIFRYDLQAGVCFHLFSSRRHDSMRGFVESELLRTPLVSARKKLTLIADFLDNLFIKLY